MSTATRAVLFEVAKERQAQDVKWGLQNHPSFSPRRDIVFRQALCDAARRVCDDAFKDDRGTWSHILTEEVAEAYAEVDPVKVRAELVQSAAVIVAWIESIDRNEIPS